MEEFTAKLQRGFKSLFGDSDSRWEQKGVGRKLGSGNAQKNGKAHSSTESSSSSQSTSRQQQGPGRQHPVSSIEAQQADLQPTIQQISTVVRTPPQPIASPTGAMLSGRLSGSLRPSDQAQGFMLETGRYSARSDAAQQAILDNVVMASTPTGAECIGLGAHLALRVAQGQADGDSCDQPRDVPGAINTPTAAEVTMGLGSTLRPGTEQDFHLQQCLAMIVSQDEDVAKSSLTTLHRLLRNVVVNAEVAKYRSIRLTNPIIQSNIVNVSGALDFLEALGFHATFVPASEGNPVTAAAAALAAEIACGAHRSSCGSGNFYRSSGGGGAAVAQAEEQTQPGASVRPIQRRHSGCSKSSSLQRRISESLALGADTAGSTTGPASPHAAGMFAPETPVQATDITPLVDDMNAKDTIEGFMILPQDASLNPVRAGLQEIEKVMEVIGISPPEQPAGDINQDAGSSQILAATSAVTTPTRATTSTRAPGQSGLQQVDGRPVAGLPVDRQTQVVLPVSPDTSVPDYFFQRTAAELKGEVARLARKRADGEILATRAWRERMAGGNSSSQQPTTTTLRIRFPEGVCLQGCFGASELSAAVFEWVTDSLRYKDVSFELVMPSRKPLPSSSRLRDIQDLWPAAIMNFRTLGGELQAFCQVPYLSDEMLALTQTE